MFYSFQLLIKTGGEFAVIWKLAHDSLKKVSRDDVLAIDIRSKCEALERYLPTGQFSAAEVKNKMSLYLLAVLQYGIVVAHARKTDFVLRDLKAAFAIMKPSFAKEQRAKKRTSNVEAPVRRKKPRKSTALQPIAEEAEDEEEEDVNLSMAIDQLPNGRPSPYVRDLREITMQEVDERPLHDFGFEHPNIDDYLNMMELQSNHGSEHSRDAFTSQRRSDLPPDLQVLHDQLEAENDFTMATLDPRMEHREADLTTTVHDLVMDGQPSMVEDGLHMGDEPMQLDVGEQMPVDPELDPESQLNDSFHLPTLTEEELQQAEVDARATAAANRRPRRQRQKRLIVDEQVEMTDLEIRRNLQFAEDICVERPPPALKVPPGLTELFGTFPCYIPFGQDELRSIFEAATEMALENVRGRQAEEEEAEPSQLELEQPAVPDFFEQPLPAEVTDGFPEAEGELSAEEIARRSGVDFVPAHEQPSLDARGPSLPFVPELVYDEHEQVQMGEPSYFDVTHPDPELAEAYEVVNITHRSPSPPTEMDAAAENLLQRIQRKKGAGPSVAFHSVCGKTKSRGARDFVNLLFLLKRRLVTAQQAKPFGPILVQ